GQVKSERPAGPAPSPPPPRVLEKLSVRWHRVLARHVHALVREDLPNGQHRLVLRAWEERSDRATLTRELARGRDLVAMVRGDDGRGGGGGGRSGPGRGGGGGVRWGAVFSGGDGRLVARVPVLRGTRQALLHDGRAYSLTARTRRAPGGAARPSHELHAYDLEA